MKEMSAASWPFFVSTHCVLAGNSHGALAPPGKPGLAHRLFLSFLITFAFYPSFPRASCKPQNSPLLSNLSNGLQRWTLCFLSETIRIFPCYSFNTCGTRIQSNICLTFLVCGVKGKKWRRIKASYQRRVDPWSMRCDVWPQDACGLVGRSQVLLVYPFNVSESTWLRWKTQLHLPRNIFYFKRKA